MPKDNPRPRAKEISCDTDIKKTLAYGAVFNYPMSKHQLFNFLITKNSYEEDFFGDSLRRLVKKKHIKAKDGKYYLPTVRPVSWKLRDKYTRELFGSSKIGFLTLRSIPWIKLLAVSGSLAANNAVKEDDVDIFIVTEKNRLWLTRGFVIILLRIINKYARGGEGSGKFCCNLFVDEVHAKWKKDDRNLYIAYEILSMHPIFERDNMYFRFLRMNDWVYKYFRNYNVTIPENIPSKQISKSLLVDNLENLARKMQMKYMAKKKTSEITTNTLIHFNKHDHSDSILNNYKENLKSLN